MPKTFDELTTALLNIREPNPGVLFARANNDTKDAYRRRVVAYFTAMPVHSLSILTFPNVRWEFERALMGESSARWHGHARLVSLERETNIYRAAIKDMPGRKDRCGFGLKFIDRPSYARCAMRSRGVRAFLHCSFEEFALSSESPVPSTTPRYFFNAAWLDFCGPLTVTRKAAFEAFIAEHCIRPARIALTFMDGRWMKDTEALWGRNRVAGIRTWLESCGAVIEGDERYITNKVAMQQFLLKFRVAD